MTRPSRREIEREIQSLKEDTRFGDDDLDRLYLKMLITASSYGENYPGAAEEYMRRLEKAAEEQEARRNRRQEEYDIDGEDGADEE